MRRGEVWWANLPRPVGRRPVVLLSRDSAYAVRTAVTVAPVTKTIRGIPVEVVLDHDDGLPARCVVNLDDLMTIPTTVIKQRISVLSGQKASAIEIAMRFALDLP